MTKANEARGNKDYRETGWCSSEPELEAAYAELADAPSAGPEAPASLTPGQHAGRLRRTVCSSSGMGIKYKTEEVQRCSRTEEGKTYEVEVCVATTATYGDRFRAVFQYRIEAIDPKSSSLKAEYQLVYVSSVNGFIKKAIERGASNGITKNFETLREVLGKLVEIQKPKTAETPLAAQAPARVKTSPPRLQHHIPWYLGALDHQVVGMVEPLAHWLRCQTGQAVAPGSNMAMVLGGSLLVVTLSILIIILQGVQEVCRTGSGWTASACHTLLSCLDVPQSVRGVVTGLLLLVAARAVLLRSRSAMGWGVAWLGLTTPPPKPLESDTPQKGVRFEGFDAALESASASIADTVEELASPPPPAKPETPNGLTTASVSVKQSSDKAVSQIKAGMKGIKRYVSEQWKASPGKGPSPAFTSVSASPPKHRRSTTEGGQADQADMDPSSPLSAVNETHAMEGPDDDSAAIVGSPPAEKTPTALTKVRVRRGLSTGQISPLLENMKTTFGLGPRPSPTPSPAQHVQQASTPVFSDDEDMSAAAVEMSMMSPREETSTEDMEAVATGPLQEEVFENERLQPWSGFGHSWPGHFLPTDRVGHWSNRSGKPGAKESMAFDSVAPQLPPGWRWVEDDWQIDMTGLVDSSVDEEGWTYAVDFNWLRMPPASGAGKKKVRDFVRRRRWIRTRLREGIDSMVSVDIMAAGSPPPVAPLPVTDAAPISLLSWAMAKAVIPHVSEDTGSPIGQKAAATALHIPTPLPTPQISFAATTTPPTSIAGANLPDPCFDDVASRRPSLSQMSAGGQPAVGSAPIQSDAALSFAGDQPLAAETGLPGADWAGPPSDLQTGAGGNDRNFSASSPPDSLTPPQTTDGIALPTAATVGKNAIMRQDEQAAETRATPVSGQHVNYAAGAKADMLSMLGSPVETDVPDIKEPGDRSGAAQDM
ncbi:hypothetical protein WJX72_002011 [[Myrmecia] bisecta]|uniref:VASt domain-containing protein n=1 Tax=[Myrmecia] bisecta TaxID=41462 RepID=A0AAW1Q8L6_9CHLO